MVQQQNVDTAFDPLRGIDRENSRGIRAGQLEAAAAPIPSYVLVILLTTVCLLHVGTLRRSLRSGRSSERSLRSYLEPCTSSSAWSCPRDSLRPGLTSDLRVGVKPASEERVLGRRHRLRVRTTVGPRDGTVTQKNELPRAAANLDAIAGKARIVLLPAAPAVLEPRPKREVIFPRRVPHRSLYCSPCRSTTCISAPSPNGRARSSVQTPKPRVTTARKARINTGHSGRTSRAHAIRQRLFLVVSTTPRTPIPTADVQRGQPTRSRSSPRCVERSRTTRQLPIGLSGSPLRAGDVRQGSKRAADRRSRTVPRIPRCRTGRRVLAAAVGRQARTCGRKKASTPAVRTQS